MKKISNYLHKCEASAPHTSAGAVIGYYKKCAANAALEVEPHLVELAQEYFNKRISDIWDSVTRVLSETLGVNQAESI